MDLAEREAGLPDVTSEVTPLTAKGVTPEVTHGVTSEVTGGVTLEVTQNETYNESINDIKGVARSLCVLFLRFADQYGTPRQYSERDQQVMESWVRQGLDVATWSDILANHIEYCAKEKRDMARGIGYFQKPVQRALSGSDDKKVAEVLRRVSGSLRRL